MNINHLLNDVKKSLGLGTFIKTKYSDYDLMAYIQSHTRNVVSRIYGYRVVMKHVSFGNHNCYDNSSLIFTLPESLLRELEQQESYITGIRELKVSMYDPNVQNAFTAPSTGTGLNYGMPNGNMHFGGLEGMTANACLRMSREMIRRPIRASFIPPNLIKFDQEGMTPQESFYDITVKVGHPLSMCTIPQSLYHIIVQLAKYDIMEFLWNNELKGLEGLSNGYDNISLKIDDWANAGTARDEYIKENLEGDIMVMEGMHSY